MLLLKVPGWWPGSRAGHEAGKPLRVCSLMQGVPMPSTLPRHLAHVSTPIPFSALLQQVHSLRSIIQPQQQRAPPRAIGQRSAPLSADERGALLGEQPLPASQQGWAAGAAGAAGQAGQATGAEQPHALRRQLMNVAEADRQRLQQMLTRSFVAAESQEMLQPGAAAEAAAGLRPGAPAPPPRASVSMAAGGIGKVVTEADLARQVDTSSQPAAGSGLALQPSGGQSRQQGAAPAKRLPVRRVEEWRPEALLCKRFNVADPYQGRPAEMQVRWGCEVVWVGFEVRRVMAPAGWRLGPVPWSAASVMRPQNLPHSCCFTAAVACLPRCSGLSAVTPTDVPLPDRPLGAA